VAYDEIEWPREGCCERIEEEYGQAVRGGLSETSPKFNCGGRKTAAPFGTLFFPSEDPYCIRPHSSLPSQW
jgi:hypothetical protein